MESSFHVRESLDAFLLQWLKSESEWSPCWQNWARHCIEGAGKALRPKLVFDFYQASSGDLAKRPAETVLRLGLAVEFLHTFSLIHDDLPCMDNDDFRRGRLTLHRLKNEATAVLMGDALQSAAFQLLASSSLSPSDAIWALGRFARGVGAAGLIEGQRLDIEARSANLQDLRKLHELKTGEVFSLSCELGVLAASGMKLDLIHAASEWGKRFGFLFQVLDDLLDRSGSRVELGKTPGKDEKLGRKTIVDFMTSAEIRKLCDAELDQMKNLATKFAAPAPLIANAESLCAKIKRVLP